MSKIYVLRWLKDNLPFWQDIDDGDRIGLYKVADILTEHAALKRENERLSDALAGAQVFAIELKTKNEKLHQATRLYLEHGEPELADELDALLTAEEQREDER